jgi:hypothetical protein
VASGTHSIALGRQSAVEKLHEKITSTMIEEAFSASLSILFYFKCKSERKPLWLLPNYQKNNLHEYPTIDGGNTNSLANGRRPGVEVFPPNSNQTRKRIACVGYSETKKHSIIINIGQNLNLKSP